MLGRPLLVTIAFLIGAASYAEERLPAGALHRFGPLRGTPVFAFAPSGKSIAIADESGRIDLYDVVTRKLQKTLRADGPAVGAIEFAPNGSMLAIAPVGDNVRLLDAATGREQRVLDAGAVVGLAFSPDGQRLAMGCGAGGVRVGDVTSGKELWRADAGARLRRAGFTPDGRFVMADAPRREKKPDALLMLDAADGKVRSEIPIARVYFDAPPSL